MIVAIDGPAASGKGTLARRLAEALNLVHLDTGKIYRAVGLKALRAGLDPGDPAEATRVARTFQQADLEDEELAGDRAAVAASKVAAIGSVRAVVLDFQRRFAAEPPAGKAGAVLDGRDIGTVVCPDADVKLFVTADVETRAKRRHKELLERGIDSIYASVLADLQERDARDAGRSVAPLRPAPDAVVIDSTHLDADAALETALKTVSERTA